MILYNYTYSNMNNKYSYTCTYYFVSTPNPLAATFFRSFLLFCEIFLFGLPPPELG